MCSEPDRPHAAAAAEAAIDAPDALPTAHAEADVVLSVQEVGKCYRLRRSMLQILRERLARTFSRSGSPGGRRGGAHEHWALRGVSFELRRGEAFAIVGRNGSGKSTLLQLITGNLQLTEGRIEISGRIGALLELGSGFHPEFTGRENVRLQGVLMGLSERRIAELLPEIEEFADLGEFFDEPVRTYSSGMFVRLAFAVQVQTEPDILIVDEALAVGDALFQKRCFRKLEQLQQKGVTLLFVSHDQETVRSLTQRALLLDRGTPLLVGSSGEVVLAYRKLLHEAERQWQEQLLESLSARERERQAAAGAGVGAGADVAAADDGGRSSQLEFGDGLAVITAVSLHDASGAESKVFATGEPMRIRVGVRTNAACDRLNVGVRLRNRQGVKICSWGTLNQDIAIRSGLLQGELFWSRRFGAGEQIEVEFAFDCRLGPDFYEVQAAVSREETPDYKNQRLLHWRDEAAFFQVTMEADRWFFGGVFDLRMRARW